MEIIFLGLLYKLTQHQMKTEGQGPDLITTDQQNFLRIYQWEDTLRNKRRFLPCYSSKISCSYLSFDVLPVISPLIWLIQSSPLATPPSFCLRNLLYVCHMKCPDRCPGEPVKPLVERGTGERESQKKLCTGLRSFTFWRSHDSICTFRIPSSLIAGAC